LWPPAWLPAANAVAAQAVSRAAKTVVRILEPRGVREM
jgi:hypothetical protein